MCQISYYQIMRNSKDKKQLRYQMVQYAIKHGNKPCARDFNTTVKTVRKWRNRFDIDGYLGLNSLSTRPNNSPNKTDKDTELKVIKAKKRYKRIGADHIRIKEDIKQSTKTMRKIWKDAGINSSKRRKKHVTKNNLRQIKKQFNLFQFNLEDTKELRDIPEYWIQMKKLNLPKIQYTFREVSTGIMFLGFADDKSLTYSSLFADYVQKHLLNFNIDLSNSIRQTDNGSEYIGNVKNKNTSAYTKVIHSIKGQKHQTIIPGCHRMQADVETVHDIIEREFFEVESFTSYSNFFDKVYSYLLFFNLERINSYKEFKSPIQLALEKVPNLNPSVLMLPPIDLRFLLNLNLAFFNNGGYDVSSGPCLAALRHPNLFLGV
jgi:transposase